MELNLSSEDAAFRDEVCAFIAKNYPAELRVPNPETDLSKEQMLLWHEGVTALEACPSVAYGYIARTTRGPTRLKWPPSANVGIGVCVPSI